VFGKIPVPLQICPSQIQKGLKWNRHQSYTITALSLTAWMLKRAESWDDYTHTQLPSNYLTNRPVIIEGDKTAVEGT